MDRKRANPREMGLSLNDGKFERTKTKLKLVVIEDYESVFDAVSLIYIP